MFNLLKAKGPAEDNDDYYLELDSDVAYRDNELPLDALTPNASSL